MQHNNGVYTTEGGEYGLYNFVLTIPDAENNKTLVVDLDYINANDWYVADIICRIDVGTKNGCYVASADVCCIYNDDSKSEYDFEINSSMVKPIHMYFGL